MTKTTAEDLATFRELVRNFVTDEVAPHRDAWEREGIVPREAFVAAGERGILGLAIPEEHGGPGRDDFRYNATVNEEMVHAGLGSVGFGIGTHNDICIPYFLRLGDEAQRQRWCPGLATGELIAAVAMTEPSTGSDLSAIRTTAVRVSGGYVLDGAKTFISNGINADLVVVAARTPNGADGLTLLVVEEGMAGFTRGRRLAKVGQHAQDTAELFFDGAHVPDANRLGVEGRGLRHLADALAQERLAIAVSAVAMCESALQRTILTVRRDATHASHVRFLLAELATLVEASRVFLDRCIDLHVGGQLTAEEAAKAKWWTTELQGRVTDRCLQIHGRHGHVTDPDVVRDFLDARVTRIYGGTTEIMKEIIGRPLGGRVVRHIPRPEAKVRT